MKTLTYISIFIAILILGCTQAQVESADVTVKDAEVTIPDVNEEVLVTKLDLIGKVNEVESDILPPEDNETEAVEKNETGRRLLGSHRGTRETCTETDSGIDYENRGSTFHLVNGTVETKTDYCVATLLVEYYCNANNSRGTTAHFCSNGCSAGACNPSPPVQTCNDSDNGRKYYIRGTTTESNGTSVVQRNDSCMIDRLFEFYCKSDNTTGVDVYNCPMGCTSRGVCNALGSASSVDASCTDSDGGADYKIQGTVSYYTSTGRKTKTDYCKDENYIYEYYCRSGGMRLFQQRCANGCLDGVCLNSSAVSTTISDTTSDSVVAFSSAGGRKLLIIDDLTPTDQVIGGSTVNFPNWVVGVSASQRENTLELTSSELLEPRWDTCTEDMSALTPDSTKTSVNPRTLAEPETDLSYRYFDIPDSFTTPYYIRVLVGTWDSNPFDVSCYSKRTSYVRLCDGSSVVRKGFVAPILNHPDDTVIAIKLSGFVPDGDLFGSDYCGLYGS